MSNNAIGNKQEIFSRICITDWLRFYEISIANLAHHCTIDSRVLSMIAPMYTYTCGI